MQGDNYPFVMDWFEERDVDFFFDKRFYRKFVNFGTICFVSQTLRIQSNGRNASTALHPMHLSYGEFYRFPCIEELSREKIKLHFSDIFNNNWQK